MIENLTSVADANVVLPSATAAGGTQPSQGSGAPSPATSAAPVVAQLVGPKAATLAELKAACPGAGNDFLVAQLEANATREQAQSAWMVQLASENKQLKEKAASAPVVEPKKPGAPPVPAAAGTAKGGADGSDAIAQFEEAVAEHMTRTKQPRHLAQQAVCRNSPELREAMIAEHNAQHRARAARKRERAA